MNLLSILTFTCLIVAGFAQECPPMEMNFLLDQSENARFAASDDPKSEETKFNILVQQLRQIFNNPVFSRSKSVSVAAYVYSANDSAQVIAPGTSPASAASADLGSQLRVLPNSGSWTWSGLRNILTAPRYSSSILFLVTSQGSSSGQRRNQAITDANRVKFTLGWNVTVLAMTSNNPFDTMELSSISPSYLTVSDQPKSYAGLAREVNKIINSICNIYPTQAPNPTTTSTTTTTTTTTTTSTVRPTTTTTTTTPRPRIIGQVCSECLYSGGFGFDSDPKYCDTFYQCLPDNQPIKKLCPAGTFWDGDQCNHMAAVSCTKAVCNANNQNVTYPSGRCCNKYYECYNGKIYENACSLNSYYDEKLRKCEPSTNRQQYCEADGKFECDVNRNNGDTSCSGYAPDPFGDPCKYQFNGYSIRVAPGTIWNQNVCALLADRLGACGAVVTERAFEATNATCNANFLATYNSGSKTVYSERAGTNIDIHSLQREVELTNNALSFSSSMTSPYFYYYFFNNKDFSTNTAFRVRFSLQNGQNGRTYDILSNSYCSLCPDTIRFTVSQTTPNSFVVTATFVTTERNSVETSATITSVAQGNLLEMTVIFGENSLSGKLYEVTSSNSLVKTSDFQIVPKTPGVHIAMNKCGIQLGRGPNNHFVGIIDEFAMYEKCKTITQVFRN